MPLARIQRANQVQPNPVYGLDSGEIEATALLAGRRRTVRAEVAYDGSLFHGFQRQDGFDSVQGAIEDALADLYLRIRAGIGYEKTVSEYGAFPTDPYSHTPQHMGAQQPGMTGQVKEQVLTLPDEVRILSGHMQATTVGAERKGNPFILRG